MTLTRRAGFNNSGTPKKAAGCVARIVDGFADRKSAEGSVVACFPPFGARRLDEITKLDIVRYLNFRRIPVATAVTLVAEGESTAAILAACADLETEDIREALLLAAETVSERTLPTIEEK